MLSLPIYYSLYLSFLPSTIPFIYPFFHLLFPLFILSSIYFRFHPPSPPIAFQPSLDAFRRLYPAPPARRRRPVAGQHRALPGGVDAVSRRAVPRLHRNDSSRLRRLELRPLLRHVALRLRSLLDPRRREVGDAPLRSLLPEKAEDVGVVRNNVTFGAFTSA